jgi:hypothetical protein
MDKLVSWVYAQMVIPNPIIINIIAAVVSLLPTVNMLQNIITRVYSGELTIYIKILCTLNLSYRTSKFYTNTMFVTTDLQTTFHIQIVSRFLTYLHTIFHMPSYSGSLVITVKPEVKETFCRATVSLFFNK